MLISIILGILALALIFLEFYLPSGAMAFAGLIVGAFSIYTAFGVDPIWGMGWSSTLLLVSILMVPRILSGLKRRNVCLEGDQKGFKGSFYNHGCIGREGIVVKDLRPSGFIEIDGVVYQASSLGEYVKRGKRVLVVDGEGGRLIVR